jgi:organic hydroperoxide reductase OsmC/OhrA
MDNNKPKPHFLFGTDMSWVDGKRSVLSANDVEGTIYVETPVAFGGQGKPWTPEHLFLGSISSCLISTYVALAGKFQFTIRGMKCGAVGQVEMVDGRYQFTQVDLYPQIAVDDDVKEKAVKAFEKATKHCLITNSLGIPVFYHSEIITGHLEGEEEKWLALPLEGKGEGVVL